MANAALNGIAQFVAAGEGVPTPCANIIELARNISASRVNNFFVIFLSLMNSPQEVVPAAAWEPGGLTLKSVDKAV